MTARSRPCCRCASASRTTSYAPPRRAGQAARSAARCLTAVAVPGYQVPFGSREMPVARGWGSGGLQVTLALVGPDDVVKVIDQGDDAGVNAANLRRLIDDIDRRRRPPPTPGEATIIQTPPPHPRGRAARRTRSSSSRCRCRSRCAASSDA